MYPRLLGFHKRTMSSTVSVVSPFKNHSPYGGLLVAGLCGFVGIKIVKNKLKEQKLKKYISTSLKNDVGVTSKC